METTKRLDGKTAIVTGSSSGIGLETARQLAARGARVILACRDEKKAAQVCEDIRQSTENKDVVVKTLNLASLQSVRDFARDVNKTESQLDILVNNAGVFCSERRLTEDGFEESFAVNYLGHFHLTNLLLDKLKASAPSRVVNVSSSDHGWCCELKFDNLQQEKDFCATKSYAQSKTALLLFTQELASRTQGSGVSVCALHPGFVRSQLMRDYGEKSWRHWVSSVMVFLSRQGWSTAQQAAERTLYCCVEPEITPGGYYMYNKVTAPYKSATNPELGQKLWEVSSDLCKISQ